MRFLGVDLHSDTVVVAILTMQDNDANLTRKKFHFSDNDLSDFIKILTQEDYVVVESTCNAFWFHDKIKPHVKECHIYDTNKLRKQGNKTDKIDSKELAQKLMFFICFQKDKKAMPTVYVPKKEVRELRSLVSTYMLYKKQLNQTKNRIHSLTKQCGYKIKGSIIGAIGFEEYIETFDLPEIIKDQIKMLHKTCMALESSQNYFKDKILLTGTKLFKDEIDILLSIKGFSVFTATVFMSDVCTVDRFKNAKKICSYLRTAPRVESSNGKNIIGKVNKESRPNTCTVLTQSVIHLQKAGEHINQFYERVKIGKSAGKARIAVIRKMIVSAYYMLKRKQKYREVNEEWYTKKLRRYKWELARAEKRVAEIEFSKKSA